MRRSDLSRNAPATCGSSPRALFWNTQPDNVTIGPGQQLTLTFQAIGSLPNGTYYNQASLRYDPWWPSPDVYVYTPYTAEVTVGSGSPKCGYDLQVLVTQEVDPAEPPPDVPTEFTHTISVENVSLDTRYVCKIEDLLPPRYVYVADSSADYVGNIRTLIPFETWESGLERWNLRWSDGSDSSLEPLASLAPGETRTQIFRASATPESGMNYYNEVNVTWASSLTGGGKCKNGQGDGGTTYAGAGESSSVDAPAVYDISSTAADGAVRSRIVFYEVAGQVEILSWQQY